jgi:simple sugar transport system permease protein
MSDEQLPQVEPDIEAEAESLELDQIPPEQRAKVDEPPMANRVLHRILTGNALISVLAVLVAFVIGGVLIAITDPGVQAAAGYFFARPGDTFRAIGDAIGGAFSALFQGAIYNFRRPGFVNGIKPLTETLTFATPLIAAGLGVALAFRVGMFNIGGRGQILIAAAVGGWVAWSVELPFFVHMLVAVLAAMVGGALWAGIAGLLKARTGAHEVIVTIMLNYVAFYLIAFLLRTPGALQDAHTNNPISPPSDPNAIMPTLSDLLGVGAFRLNFGFILVILATLLFWFLMNRSSLGFRFRAVGENPHAARVAGINV